MARNNEGVSLKLCLTFFVSNVGLIALVSVHAGHLKDILDKYCKAFRQFINIIKSTLFFNKGVGPQERKVVEEVLDMRTTSNLGK